MYLMMVENNYISSRKIKSVLDNNNISCEIVKFSSNAALLEIAKKVAPEMVIIDFDLVVNDSVNMVKELRHHCPGAYIIAFVDPDQHSRLHQAIDDGIDNFMFKSLQREDVLLRIKIGLQHQNIRGIKAIEDREISTEPVPETISVPEEPAADSKKIFEDLADLFTREPLTENQPEDDQMFEKLAPNVAHSESETIFEEELELPEEMKFSIDDKELFGLISEDHSVDRSSFEDLFNDQQTAPAKAIKQKAKLQK